MTGDSLIHNFDEYFSKESVRHHERRKSVMMDRLTLAKLKKESENISKSINVSDIEMTTPLLKIPEEKQIKNVLLGENNTKTNNKDDNVHLDDIT